MIRLLAAEFNRLRSRRITLIAAAAVFIGLALYLVGTQIAVSPPSADEIASARQDYQEQLRVCQTEGMGVESERMSAEECQSMLGPEEDWVPGTESYRSVANVGALVASVLVMLAAYLVGASFIGAEYSTGSVTNWLTFIPRRLSVVVAKLLVIAVGAAAAAAVALTVALGGAAALTAMYGGSLSGAADAVETGGRGLILAALAAILGFCVALLTRHTAAASGVVLGYLILSFILQLLTFAVPAFQHLPRWLPEQNLFSFLTYGSTYQTFPPNAAEPVTHTITFTHSAIYWGIILVAAVAVTVTVFRRRDVT